LPLLPDIWGTFACSAEDFAAIGGFDEAFRGWGGEDDDLYMRLEDNGCRPSPFPAALIEAIQHQDAERVTHYDIKDRWVHHRVNVVYIAAKADLTRILGRPLSFHERKHLFAESQRGASSARPTDTGMVLEINLPADPRLPLHPDWALEHRLVYRFSHGPS
jgi:hypothetical protein